MESRIPAPSALSCAGGVSDTRGEVATPELVSAHCHFAEYAKYIPVFNPQAEVMMLIGR